MFPARNNVFLLALLGLCLTAEPGKAADYGRKNARLASQIEISSDYMVEIPIDQNGNGLSDYLSLSPMISGPSGDSIVLRATLHSANGPVLIANDTPFVLRSSPQHVNFDFNGPLIRELRMLSPFTLELSVFNAEDPGTVIKTVSLRLKHSYDYSRFDLLR
jgi:hypothetical protein